MKIEEQVLSREQMAHLKELGVDTSDASMAYYNIPIDNQPDKWILGIANKEVASIMLSNGITEMEPTYTIGDIIEILPKYYYAIGNPIKMSAINGSGAFVVYYYNIADTYIMKDDTIKDALYKLLCWVAENHKELFDVRNE